MENTFLPAENEITFPEQKKHAEGTIPKNADLVCKLCDDLFEVILKSGENTKKRWTNESIVLAKNALT